MAAPSLEQAYDHCLAIVRGHYENFPVASMLLPKPMRRSVAAIYAFARRADDIADEGDTDETSRLRRLGDCTEQLRAIEQNIPPDDPVFIALADTIRRHDPPLQCFHDLLTAFRLDVTKKRYADFGEVLDYCRHSANPVGRLLLYLQNAADPVNLRDSDTVCTAFQLINFLQDLEQDYRENGRIYLPQDEMRRFGVAESHFQQRTTDDAMRRLMHCQIVRARELMRSGQPLGTRLRGRFALQLRIMINGGLQILEALERQHHDVFSRPRLTRSDWRSMIGRAVMRR